MKALSMTEIAAAIEDKTGVKPNLTKNIIKALVEVAEEEIAEGHPFTINGFVKFSHGYKPALKKGRDVRNPQTGEIGKAPEGRPAQITVKARALARIKKAAPTVTSKAGKPIAAEAKQRAEASAARRAEREAAEA